ncbi:CpaF family protein [Chloroflexota bacterium]
MSLLRRIEKGNSGKDSGSDGPDDNEEQSKLAQMRVRQRSAPTGAAAARESYMDIKSRVQTKLLAELDPSMDMSRHAEIRTTMEELFTTILAEENIVLSRAERQRLFDQIVAEILGLGPIEPLLADESVTEIMVNGPKSIYVERKGNLHRVNVTFESEDHVLRILDRIVAPLGRRIDESQPYVDARLQDGSRVNAVIRPISLVGPTITIRKFSKQPLTIDDLIRFGSITPAVVEFMRACVIARMNIIVSGGTGSGKTTLLNVLSSFIPDDERIVTVENAAELQLRQDHVITIETRPPNIEGKGEITIQDMVVNCLRMRPDRIVVGECRGGEALDMLQAMNTGHDGSLTTAHSNSPRDTISRLEVMCLMSGMDLPVRAIREQIASAVQLICHQERMRDGTRKVTKVTEVQGMEGDVIVLSDIFEFEQTGIEAGKVIGRVKPTGLRPKFMDTLEQAGIHLPPSVFGVGASY